jgi:hypothetical protein
MKKIIFFMLLALILISCSDDESAEQATTLVRIVNKDPNMDAIIAYCFDDNFERGWEYPLQNIQLSYGDSTEVTIETKKDMLVRHNLIGMIDGEEFIYNWQGVTMQYEEGILRIECIYCPAAEFPNNHQFSYAYWPEEWDGD